MKSLSREYLNHVSASGLLLHQTWCYVASASNEAILTLTEPYEVRIENAEKDDADAL